MPGYDTNLLHDVKCFQAVAGGVIVASRYFSLASLCNTFKFVVYNSMEYILYDFTIYRILATRARTRGQQVQGQKSGNTRF